MAFKIRQSGKKNVIIKLENGCENIIKMSYIEIKKEFKKVFDDFLFFSRFSIKMFSVCVVKL